MGWCTRKRRLTITTRPHILKSGSVTANAMALIVHMCVIVSLGRCSATAPGGRCPCTVGCIHADADGRGAAGSGQRLLLRLSPPTLAASSTKEAKPVREAANPPPCARTSLLRTPSGTWRCGNSRFPEPLPTLYWGRRDTKLAHGDIRRGRRVVWRRLWQRHIGGGGCAHGGMLLAGWLCSGRWHVARLDMARCA